jgi:hypothetical protein
MRIKAWIVTGTGAVLSATALAIVVTMNDPFIAEPSVYWTVWIALALTLWSMAITFFLLLRMHMQQAVWVGCVAAGGVLGCVLARHAGYQDGRLLGAIIFGTLSVSFFIWRRFRNLPNGRT